jgi:hypothetical protein
MRESVIMKSNTRNLVVGYVVVVAVVVLLDQARRVDPDHTAVTSTQGTSASPTMTTRTADHGAGREMRASRTGRDSPREEMIDDAPFPQPVVDDGRPVYTMENFPDEPGIHRVLVDGELLELAVDHPGDIGPASQDDVDP